MKNATIQERLGDIAEHYLHLRHLVSKMTQEEKLEINRIWWSLGK